MDAANLFSGVQRPFNTITSPDQQDAAATGNDQGPTDQPQDQSPMAKILAAVMRGAARVQGTEQAKSIAKSQMDSNARMTVTMKPGAPGQPPFVTVKDAPADLLNGTQQSDLVAAHDTPINQVERKLSPQSEAADNAPVQAPPTPAPTVPPPADHPLEKTFSALDASQGYREPRPWDTDIREKLKTPDGIKRLNFEMGGTAQDAAMKIRQIQRGEVTLDEAAQRVANFRLQRGEEKAQKLEAAMAPAERDAERKQAEADRQDRIALAKQEELRRLKSQSDAETKTANEEKLGFLKSNDLSLLDADPAKMLAAVHAGTNATWTPQDDQRALLKRQQDVNAAFKDFTDTKKNTFSLGNYDSWEEAKGAFGFPLSPEQDRMGAGRWKADHAYVLREAALLRSTQEGRAAKLEHLQYLNEHQGDVKPVAVDDGFVKNVSATDLLGVLPTVRNPDLVLQRKEALLRNEIQDRSEKLRKAQADANSVNGTPVNQRKYGWETQLVNYQVDAKTHADRITAAKDELQQIRAARAARAGGKVVAPTAKPTPRPINPTKGQTWQGPTGIQTFDGRGWVQ